MKQWLSSLTVLLACLNFAGGASAREPTNILTDDRMLLVLAAPSVLEELPADLLNSFINFQINYARQVIQHGQDNVIILVDADTRSRYRALPDDVLLTVPEGMHVWTRDFTTVNPFSPVSFQYTDATMSRQESVEVQDLFDDFVKTYDLDITQADYLLDGGNLVDNYAGDVIVTERFLVDNNLSRSAGKSILKWELGADAVAIIEADEEIMAHADGMLMWLDEETLLVNDYSKVPDFGREYQEEMMYELETTFPEASIIPVPAQFSHEDTSACGVNLNTVLTNNALYVPVFGGNYSSNENQVLNAIKANSSRMVITVEANSVCDQGGSVRCLTWQLTGDNADKLIRAAGSSAL